MHQRFVLEKKEAFGCFLCSYLIVFKKYYTKKTPFPGSKTMAKMKELSSLYLRPYVIIEQEREKAMGNRHREPEHYATRYLGGK